MPVTYRTTIAQAGKTATGIPVPDHVLEELGGGRRPAVTVDLGGYRYRTTGGIVSGQVMLPFSAAHRAASGLGGGDAVTVTLELDDAPRELQVPPDLRAALDAEPDARRFFDGLASTYQRNFVTQIEAAKQPETRARRIATTIEKLKAGKQR